MQSSVKYAASTLGLKKNGIYLGYLTQKIAEGAKKRLILTHFEGPKNI